jgi:hypothetical protein
VEKTKRFSVSLPYDLHKKFKLKCVATDTQMAEAICKLVERDLERHDQKTAKAVRAEVRA